MATFAKQMQQNMPQQAPLLAFGMAEERAARSVFVGNIPYEATEEQLKEIFNQAGPVVSFRLVYDRETGKPKGYGFCEYQDLETAQCAMRNLNNHDFNGRPLRVGVAAGEQGKDEGRLMQQALGGPAMESPFGEPVETEKAPEAISRAVASLPPEQMFELMKQMKLCIQNNPNEARNMLLQNPQLAYALLQAQIVMKIVDPQVALAMLHRPTEQIPPLLPSSSGSSSAAGSLLSTSQPPVNQSPQNLEARPGFGPSASVGRGGPLLGPGPSLGPGGVPVMGPSGMMGGVGPGPSGNLGPGPEFGPRGPMPGPRVRGGLLGDMPPSERRDGPGPVGPRGPGGFIGDPRGPVRAEMVGRDPGHLMMNMGGSLGPRADMGMGLGPRADMGPGLRPDGGMGPRRDLGPGMGHGPRMEMGPGQRPRMDMGPGPHMEMGPRDMDARPPRGMPVLLGDVREPRPDSDMRTARIQPMNAPGSAVRPAGPSPGPATPGVQISPQDQEKAALIMQVLQLSDEQIAMLPSDQRQSILILKEQIARSASK